MSDFSDRPLVAGTITGLRSFRVDKYGRLVGVIHRCVFKPGENLARCRESVHNEYRYVRFDGLPSYPDKGEGATSTDKHQVGRRSCQCGYYAYFDQGNNPYHNSGNILALIEGRGLVTVGSRGFRAEKARLVALVSQRGGLGRIGPVAWMLISAVMLLAAALALPLQVSPWLTIPAFTVSGVYLFVAIGLAVDKPKNLVRLRSHVPDGVANLYGVPVYRSIRSALKAHPLTPPPPPSPENDEEFWTRSAA